MTTLRMLMLTLLVVVITSLPVATSVAYASGLDAAQGFASYLWQYLGG